MVIKQSLRIPDLSGWAVSGGAQDNPDLASLLCCAHTWLNQAKSEQRSSCIKCSGTARASRDLSNTVPKDSQSLGHTQQCQIQHTPHTHSVNAGDNPRCKED